MKDYSRKINKKLVRFRTPRYIAKKLKIPNPKFGKISKFKI